MKNKFAILTSGRAWLVLLAFLAQVTTASAQGTAFTYQGRLNDASGPARGTYDITLTLFNAVTGGAIIGPSNVFSGLAITNGLFTAAPDFGPQFNGLDRWLEIAVRTNGGSSFSLLSPRQKLTPTPYSLYAPQAGTATTAFGVTTDAVGSSGLQSSSVTSAKIADGSITAADVNSASFSNTFWKVDGNAGTTPGTHFLGTTDNRPVEFRVNGGRALRLEPKPNGAPNVIGGSPSNGVAVSVEGATIAGGGLGLFPNTITASYATIGGGTFNSVAGGWSTIAGGRDNNGTGNYATLSGGILNTIQTNADAATIGGGDGNIIRPASVWSTIGGGRLNVVDSNVFSATIAGGEKNSIAPNASFSSMGGGLLNSAASDYATVGGGNANSIQTNATHATISGGAFNTVRSNAVGGTVSGGFANTVGSTEGTVAGGAFNSALGFSSTIGGGGGNTANGGWSTIAGGRDNVLTNVDYAAIGGGVQNTIQSNATFSTIAGGGLNIVRSNASRATVGGGFVNTAGAPEGTVAGGAFNSALAFSSTVGGGGGNTASGEWSTIAGGRDNLLNTAHYATIGGGLQNTIQSNGFAATVPGGWLNSATDYAFAAGHRAKANHTGAFVWADATDADHSSTGTNQFLIRASGGVGINNNNPNGAALAVNGDVNVEGIVSVNALSAASATTPQLNTPRIATSGNVPLELFVNGQRGLRLEPTASTDTVNLIGGSANNFVGAGVLGATIAGGGAAFSPNTIMASYAAIGGGTFNTAGGGWATIGGGTFNTIKTNAHYATVGGGLGNNIGTNSSHSLIAGGEGNSIPDNSSHSSIGGGFYNTSAALSAIGGGYQNTIDASFSAMGGGNQNTIAFPAIYSMVGGGDNNNIAGAWSVIGGGDNNNIAAESYNGTIAGGHYNSMGFNSRNSTIGGGSGNIILYDAQFATISGGSENRIQTNGHFGIIPGGRLNSATNYAFAAGNRAKANRTGAFVWADSTEADFAATANNQFLIRAGGGVGIGTPNPKGTLHVYSANNPTVMRVQSTGTPGFGRIEFVSNPQGDTNEWRPGYIQSTDNGGFTGGLSFVVNGTGAANKFSEVETMRIVNGRVGIGTPTPVSALQVIGTVTATAFNPPSDRNLKENFAPVSPREVLEKVAAMPISRWNFKGDSATPHVGPMAQDFHAAFNLGTDDRHIATVDADGVALAAIQGLNQKLAEKDAELQALKQTVAELKAAFERLSAAPR